MFELGPILSHLFTALRSFATAHGVPADIALLITKIIQVNIVVLLVSLIPMVLVYAERKVSAFMQARLGPMNVGPWGIFQTLADGIKLMFKEDVVPIGADKWVHFLAPVIAVGPVFVCYAPVPFGNGLTPIDLDTGVLFILALSGISTIGVLLAGWGSANKFSMIGGLRGAAQLVSYEIPRVLSIVPVLMWYSSMSLRTIAIGQQGRWFGFFPKWFIFYPVVGQIAFLIFLICSVAETNRTPFDIPEAESELVAGFHTEFGGMKFALFFLAEYAYVFLASAMGTALFLGGGDGFLLPNGLIPSWIWFLMKTFALVFLFLWFRWTYPRMRVDQLMSFCWKFLMPWSFANIALTGFLVLVRAMMSHIPSLVFYALATVLVLLSIAVVSLRNVFHSALALVGALTVVAGLFLLAGADFLGAAQILVYVGGIMIIMLFVIMLSQQPKDRLQRQTNEQWVAGLFFSLVIGISLVRAFRLFVQMAPPPGAVLPTSAPLGRLLLGEMLLPFEVVSLILLQAALVGAVFFGQDRMSS